ncbi:MAG: L-threonylcarbamoyladenylate synthase [Solirubrobacterales bacterium]
MTEVVSLEADGTDAARAALERCISGGGVAIFPADTLYGLACDPLNEAAVSRIHSLKRRESDKPSAVMYFSPQAMRELVDRMGPATREAVGSLLPGPVTLVIANPARHYPLACGADPGTLGVRLIGGPLGGAMHPVFQTSANRSGDEPPARFDRIRKDILAGADVAIDGGELGGAPSTVIDLSGLDSGAGWTVLREGEMAVAEVERRLGAPPA